MVRRDGSPRETEAKERAAALWGSQGGATVSDAYATFLASKARTVRPSGFAVEIDSPHLFPFQAAIVRWACMRGRAAIFADTGLGKSRMQLAWADRVAAHTGGRVLIIAPLAVTRQTAQEAAIIGIETREIRSGDDGSRIAIINYESLHKIDTDAFTGVVIDESSCLKDLTGKTRTDLIQRFANTPYKLCCTATPAPNDFTELGNHAQFLGIMTHAEMLSMFFVHDGGSTQDWRLKGHAVDAFWSWVCEWAVVVRHPRDIGFDMAAYDLPELRYHETVVESRRPANGLLFGATVTDLNDRRAERRSSIEDRVEATATIADFHDDEQLLIWCDLNAEADGCIAAIPGAEQVAGSDSLEDKEDRLIRFSEGKLRVLVTKSSIAGHGLNLQRCSRMIFCGLSDSFEAFYQSVRRCWRFGQTKPVNVHVVISAAECAVTDNVARKQKAFEEMGRQVVRLTRAKVARSLGQETMRMTSDRYELDTAAGKSWLMELGDCVEVVRDIESESVGYSIFSPPFASLYTYSASDRDMGNCAGIEDFMQHFGFLIRELLRVTKPGRLLSFHCMNLPTSKARDGYIGIRDFRGELIRAFVDAGWIYHSEVCIWKDPVTAMQRTKALGLLHKQLKKDSCMSRQGIADYVVTMRKPGDNTDRVENTDESFPVREWQEYASPVWMDINPGDTLQNESARDDADERHVCPLQLEVIRRCLRLWSKPDDLILSPFAGIGSEGYEAVKAGRRFLGVELKSSYFKQACANLARAEATRNQGMLFKESVG